MSNEWNDNCQHIVLHTEEEYQAKNNSQGTLPKGAFLVCGLIIAIIGIIIGIKGGM